MLRKLLATILAIELAAITVAAAQTSQKPLTNDDVVAMVKGGLGESTIIGAVQSQDTNFDISTVGLLQLKKSGVASRVMDTMLAATKRKAEAAQAAAATSAPKVAAPATLASPTPGQPSVVLIQGSATQLLPAGRTQIVQTKSKASTLGALASDGTLTEALGGVAQGIATAGMMKPGSAMGIGAMTAMPMLAPAMMATSLLSRRKPTVTDVWALGGQKSETVIHATQPAFEVNYEDIPGINADEYEPVLLKLEPTPNNYRLVGATQAKQDALQASAADWGMYSSFVEERVPAQATKEGPGNYQLQPSSALAAGEYGVALRPINKDKKFSGSAVSQNTGDGMAFNSVWSFAVR
jgi:hypothetical protein